METPQIFQTPGQNDQQVPVESGSKKKIVVLVIVAVIIIGAVVYFVGGGGFQGRIKKDMARVTSEKVSRSPDNTSNTSFSSDGMVSRGSGNPPSIDSEVAKKADEEEAARKAAEEKAAADKVAADKVAADKAAAEKATADKAAADKAAADKAAADKATADKAAAEKSAAEKAAAEDKAAAEEAAKEPVFDSSSFNLTALMEPIKGGGFNSVNIYSTIKYVSGGQKDSYRICVNLPTYSQDKEYKYEVPLSAIACKQSSCSPARTEKVTVFRDFKEDSCITVTRGELNNAVKNIGAGHGEKVVLGMEITDPNGKKLSGNGAIAYKIEDDALKTPFNLDNFKLIKGEYVPASDGPFIQLNYSQANDKTGEYFYTGDKDSFKFFIEVCDKDGKCANYVETDDTDVASGGGAWPIPISQLQALVYEQGLGNNLTFKLAVQDGDGAQKYYAKGSYPYMLGN